MDPNISFDPNKLSEDEKNAILNKIESNSAASDCSNCIIWTKKAQKNGYPQMKLTTKIAAKFGNPDRPFNPASILVSLNTDIILYKNTHTRLSHLCHNKFCVNIHHLVMEPLATNIQRNGCRDNNFCTGHSNSPNCQL